MDKHPQGQDEPANQPEKELDETDLEQVSGGFDPQPEPPALRQKGSQNHLLPAVQKVQKGLQKISGDPIGA